MLLTFLCLDSFRPQINTNVRGEECQGYVRLWLYQRGRLLRTRSDLSSRIWGTVLTGLLVLTGYRHTMLNLMRLMTCMSWTVPTLLVYAPWL